MSCLSNACFICLNSKDTVNSIILQHAEKEIVQQVKFVVPEIVILESRLPLLVCSTCRQTLDTFRTFKKICLENNYRYNKYINKLQASNSSSEPTCGELEIKVSNNTLQTNVNEEGNTDSNIEKVEANDNSANAVINIKEELSIDEDSTNSFCEQIVKEETEPRTSNCVDQITEDQIQLSDQFQTKDLKCTLCNETFLEKSYLQKHMMMTHTMTKKRKCLVCDKFFNVKSLRGHMKAHAGIKDFKCSVCNKMFVSNPGLKDHMKIHAGVKDYKCSVCNKNFGKKSNLNRHMLIHIGT